MCFLTVLFNLYSKYLKQEAFESFGDFRLGGEVICAVNYTDDLMLLAKKEVLQGMID